MWVLLLTWERSERSSNDDNDFSVSRILFNVELGIRYIASILLVMLTIPLYVLLHLLPFVCFRLLLLQEPHAGSNSSNWGEP